jgi:dethiobiotin synthetase
MTRLFITATGTEIGKTFVTAALARAAIASGRTVRALKPVASGFDPAAVAESDSGRLMAAQGLPDAALDRVSPWRYAAPLSPDMAAAREGGSVPFDALIAFCRDAIGGPEQVVLIEGVGGVMVPLDGTRTVLDWIGAVGIPVVLVAGSYLGTISHTLTALRALTTNGAALRSIVLSQSLEEPVPMAETKAVMARFAGSVPILTLPRRSSPDAAGPELAALLG